MAKKERHWQRGVEQDRLTWLSPAKHFAELQAQVEQKTKPMASTAALA